MKYERSNNPRYRAVCMQTGLCKFIPLPFVDDLLIGWLRRRLVRKALQTAELSYGNGVPGILANWRQQSFGEKLRSFLTGLILKPLRKLFRTVFFWLTVRDAGRTATETYLLVRFIHSGEVTGISEPVTTEDAKRLAQAFGEAVKYCEKDVAKTTWRKIWSRLQKRNHTRVAGVVKESTPGFLSLFDSRYRAALDNTANA